MSAEVQRGSWLVTLPLALLAVGYLALFYLPGRRAISQAVDQIEQRKEFLAQAASLGTALGVAEQEAEKADRFVALWEKSCPPAEELSALYGEIYALAEAAGVGVTRFDPEAVVRAERSVRIPLKMGCRGRFDQVFGFLARLEDVRYDVWTTDLRMERMSEDGEDISCELNLIVFADNSGNSDYLGQSD